MVANWTEVLTKAWSIYLLGFIGALQYLPKLIETAFPDYTPTPETVGLITAIAAIAGIIVRLLPQANLKPVVEEPVTTEPVE